MKQSKPFRLAIAGLGTVGASLVQLIEEHNKKITDGNGQVGQEIIGQPISIVGLSARDKNKKRAIDISTYEFFSSAEEMARDVDYDALVELVGGVDGVAPAIWQSAIDRHKTIITANKALLAMRAGEFVPAIEKNNSQLYFEAAVMGAVPVIDTIKNSLRSLDISGFYGIVNGTCNYILSTMKAKKLPFAEVLADAQQKGYAEADPSFDIDGTDALHKLVILTILAFGTMPNIDNIYTRGVRDIDSVDIHYAGLFNFSIKLFATAKKMNDQMMLSVEPMLIEKNRIMAKVGDALNAINIESTARGPLLLIGRGAGGMPTASAVLADVITAQNNQIDAGEKTPQAAHNLPHLLPFGRPFADIMNNKLSFKNVSDDEARFYIRLSVADKVGVIATCSTILRDAAISIEKLHQNDDRPVHISIITHATRRENIAQAITKIKELDAILKEPVVMKLL
ncbi:MAG: homoserine dehydrogenase [Hydrotalea sp.]|nr:homoserine dehydrogenase [Hydrotalea sp.]